MVYYLQIIKNLRSCLWGVDRSMLRPYNENTAK